MSFFLKKLFPAALLPHPKVLKAYTIQTLLQFFLNVPLEMTTPPQSGGPCSWARL